MYLGHIDAHILIQFELVHNLFGVYFVFKNLTPGVTMYTATRCDWLKSARGHRIVFFICWVRESQVDAISAYLRVKLVLPRSPRLKVLKRSKNAITIEYLRW